MVQTGRYGVGRRSDTQQIDNHGLIPPSQRQVHGKAEVGRPMPIKQVLVILAIPGPIYFFPDLGDFFAQQNLVGLILAEVRTGGKQPLDQKSRLYKVAPIIHGTERDGNTGIPVHPVRKSAAEAVGILQECRHQQQSLQPLLAGNEPPLDAYQYGHDAKAGAANGNGIEGGIPFADEPRARVGKIPEVAEGVLLYHLQEFLVTHIKSSRTCGCRSRGFLIGYILGGKTVLQAEV